MIHKAQLQCWVNSSYRYSCSQGGVFSHTHTRTHTRSHVWTGHLFKACTDMWLFNRDVDFLFSFRSPCLGVLCRCNCKDDCLFFKSSHSPSVLSICLLSWLMFGLSCVSEHRWSPVWITSLPDPSGSFYLPWLLQLCLAQWGHHRAAAPTWALSTITCVTLL